MPSLRDTLASADRAGHMPSLRDTLTNADRVRGHMPSLRDTLANADRVGHMPSLRDTLANADRVQPPQKLKYAAPPRPPDTMFVTGGVRTKTEGRGSVRTKRKERRHQTSERE